jgi:hypothetical protein
MSACWTNHEISRLVEMHRDRTPPLKELVAAFPRHPLGSIKAYAFARDLRHKDRFKWLRIAHLHFSSAPASTASSSAGPRISSRTDLPSKTKECL